MWSPTVNTMEYAQIQLKAISARSETLRHLGHHTSIDQMFLRLARSGTS